MLSLSPLKKALDVWLITSFCYTFTVLFEYCAVLHLSRDENDWYNKIGNGKGGGSPKKAAAFKNRNAMVCTCSS